MQVKLFHEIEHFQRGNALRVRRHFVHRPAAIGRRDRFDPFARIIGKIFRRERAAMPRGERQNSLGDFPLIKRVAPALRDLPQRPGEIGIAHDFAQARRAVRNQIRVRRRLIVAKQIDIRREVLRDPLRHRITVLGDLNRRGQHLIHFLFAEAVEQLLPPIDGPGNGDGLDPSPRHLAQTFLAQSLDRLRGGSPAAGVQAIIFSALRVVHDRE